MRIVITGASGNVGTALLRRLHETTEHDLVGVVRRPPEPPVTRDIVAEVLHAKAVHVGHSSISSAATSPEAS